MFLSAVPEKAADPHSSSFLGMVTFFSLLHPANAQSSIFLTLPGSFTFFILSLFSNADSPIAITFFPAIVAGIVTFFPFPIYSLIFTPFKYLTYL